MKKLLKFLLRIKSEEENDIPHMKIPPKVKMHFDNKLGRWIVGGNEEEVREEENRKNKAPPKIANKQLKESNLSSSNNSNLMGKGKIKPKNKYASIVENSIEELPAKNEADNNNNSDNIKKLEQCENTKIFNNKSKDNNDKDSNINTSTYIEKDIVNDLNASVYASADNFNNYNFYNKFVSASGKLYTQEEYEHKLKTEVFASQVLMQNEFNKYFNSQNNMFMVSKLNYEGELLTLKKELEIYKKLFEDNYKSLKLSEYSTCELKSNINISENKYNIIELYAKNLMQIIENIYNDYNDKNPNKFNDNISIDKNINFINKVICDIYDSKNTVNSKLRYKQNKSKKLESIIENKINLQNKINNLYSKEISIYNNMSISIYNNKQRLIKDINNLNTTKNNYKEIINKCVSKINELNEVINNSVSVKDYNKLNDLKNKEINNLLSHQTTLDNKIHSLESTIEKNNNNILIKNNELSALNIYKINKEKETTLLTNEINTLQKALESTEKKFISEINHIKKEDIPKLKETINSLEKENLNLNKITGSVNIYKEKLSEYENSNFELNKKCDSFVCGLQAYKEFIFENTKFSNEVVSNEDEYTIDFSNLAEDTKNILNPDSIDISNFFSHFILILKNIICENENLKLLNKELNKELNFNKDKIEIFDKENKLNEERIIKLNKIIEDNEILKKNLQEKLESFNLYLIEYQNKNIDLNNKVSNDNRLKYNLIEEIKFLKYNLFKKGIINDYYNKRLEEIDNNKDKEDEDDVFYLYLTLFKDINKDIDLFDIDELKVKYLNSQKPILNNEFQIKYMKQYIDNLKTCNEKKISYLHKQKAKNIIFDNKLLFIKNCSNIEYIINNINTFDTTILQSNSLESIELIGFKKNLQINDNKVLSIDDIKNSKEFKEIENKCYKLMRMIEDTSKDYEQELDDLTKHYEDQINELNNKINLLEDK